MTKKNTASISKLFNKRKWNVWEKSVSETERKQSKTPLHEAHIYTFHRTVSKRNRRNIANLCQFHLRSVLFCSVSSLIKTHAENFTKMKYMRTQTRAVTVMKTIHRRVHQKRLMCGTGEKSRDLHWSKSIGRSCQSTITFFSLSSFVRSLGFAYMLARYIHSILGLKIYS